MLRLVLVSMLLSLGWLAAPALAAPSAADDPYTILAGGSAEPAPESLTPVEKQALSERSLGDATAPVTVVEYASLTCPHCAAFYTNIFPAFKAKYIDTGKVHFIYRDFPLDGMALKAAAVARCLPEERYFGFIEVLFRDQIGWAHANDPDAELLRLSKLAGLPEKDAKACMGDKALLDTIAARRYTADKQDQIAATPTFIINNGAARIEGAESIDDFAQHIDPILTAAQGAKK